MYKSFSLIVLTTIPQSLSLEGLRVDLPSFYFTSHLTFTNCIYFSDNAMLHLNVTETIMLNYVHISNYIYLRKYARSWLDE